MVGGVYVATYMYFRGLADNKDLLISIGYTLRCVTDLYLGLGTLCWHNFEQNSSPI